MGAVYRGENIATGRAVAVKLVHAVHAENTQIVGRLKREARATAAIEMLRSVPATLASPSSSTMSSAAASRRLLAMARRFVRTLREARRMAPPEITIERLPPGAVTVGDLTKLLPAGVQISTVRQDHHNRLPEAETVFREAVKLDPRLADAHFGLGRVFARTDRHAESEVACREAVRLNPAAAYAWAGLGAALERLERPGEAADAHREAARLTGP